MKESKVILAVATVLMLAACASNKPDIGSIMQQHAIEDQAAADLQKKLSKDWKRGSKLVQTGTKRAQQGEKALERGNQEVAEGTKLMEESERRFREAFPDLTLEVDSK